MIKHIPLFSLLTLALVACKMPAEVPEMEDSAAPEADDSVAPEADDSAAPEADDSAAPETDDSAAPEADDSAEPEPEPAQDPCDPASEYTLRTPYPVESPWDAFDLYPTTAPEIALLTYAVSTMQNDIAGQVEMDAMLGVEPNPDCVLIEADGSQTYRGDCNTTLGSAFSGELVWGGADGGLLMTADNFKYHSYIESMFFAADGVFSVTQDADALQASSAMDLTVISDERWLSYRQDVCTQSDASGDHVWGYVHLGLTDDFAFDYDFLIDWSMSYDADGAPVEVMQLTGTSVMVLRQDATTTPGCWAFELDGVAQEEFCT